VGWTSFSPSSPTQRAILSAGRHSHPRRNPCCRQKNFLSVNGAQLTGTLVVIESVNGREVELLSPFDYEEEVLFSYNTFFKVDKWIAAEADKRALLPQFSGYDISNLAVLHLQEL